MGFSGHFFVCLYVYMYTFHFFFFFIFALWAFGLKHDVDAVFHPHLINEFHFSDVHGAMNHSGSCAK